MENIVLKKKVGKYQFVKGRDILWSRRKYIQRAGVILYFTDQDEKIHFILGLDKNHNEWTDFGGTVNEKENGGEAAIREMKEETLGVFDDLLKNDIKQIITEEGTVAVIEKNMVILFIHLPISSIEEFTTYKGRYEQKVEERKQVVENISIEVFTAEELKSVVKGEKKNDFPMYKVVSQHLNKKIFDLVHWSSPTIYSPK